MDPKLDEESQRYFDTFKEHLIRMKDKAAAKKDWDAFKDADDAITSLRSFAYVMSTKSK